MNLRIATCSLAVSAAFAGTLPLSAAAAPTVSFVKPSAGATLSGAISQSSACEVRGSNIDRVRFYLDSTSLNTEENGPWNCDIDTRKFSDGTHTLKAVAYDSAGTSRTAQISVNIKNSSGATVSFKAPAEGQTLSGKLDQSSACEVTGSGITKVAFFLDGTALNTEGSSPWQCNLDTTKFPDGAHVLKAVAYNSAGAATTAQIGVKIQNGTAPAAGAGYTGTPFTGTPIALPKAFEAAKFDKGGQGVAYKDLVPGNAGGQYRTSEDVDIIASSDAEGGPYAVNNFETGEWLAYTVQVPASGNYDLAVRAASKQSSPAAAFHIEVDGVNVTGPITVPNTGSWSGFRWVGKQGVSLTEGKRILKVVSEQQYLNLNALSVLASSAPAPAPAPGSDYGVQFTAPAANGTLSGVLNQSSACEVTGAGLAKVQFFLDGTALNTEGGAPWQCNIDTTKFSNGAHTLKAVATYSDGRTGTTQIPVSISNGTVTQPADGTSPWLIGGGYVDIKHHVYFTAPAVNGTLSGVIEQSSACEVAGAGIAKVQFYLDGTALNTEGGAPWQCNIDTTKFSSGAHTLKAVATYTDGKTSTAQIGVNISNGGTSSPLPSDGNADFSCSFENSPTECGFSNQTKDTSRTSLVSVARDGVRGVRLETQPGDTEVSGSGSWERNDLRLGQAATDCSEGKEHWWAHSVMFPSDYVPPASGGVVMDFHHTGSSGQANFHVDAMSWGLRLRGYGGATVDSGKFEVSLGPVVKNQWYDFVYRVKWSSGSDGYFHAWVNGVQKLAHNGPTLYKGMGCYLKLANYHDSTGEASAVIHDRVKRGKSASDVARTPLQ